jgi:hypothetical protein
MCNISDDTKQRLKATIGFGSESFKVLMAAMLSLFVPQRCVNEPDGLCTLKDNLTDLTPFNIAVVVINFTTLAGFIALYVVEYMRENWCIEWLDVDPTKPNNNLDQEIEKYPQIKTDMTSLNNKYYIISWIMVGMNIVNFVTSSVLIYGYYYLDYRSVTVLITNVLLVADKLATCFSIATRSIQEELPVSAYMATPVVFNTIDKDHKNDGGNNIELVDTRGDKKAELIKRINLMRNGVLETCTNQM